MKKVIFYISIFIVLVFSLVNILSSQSGDDLLRDDTEKSIDIDFGNESRLIKDKENKNIFIAKSANLEKIIGFGNVTKVLFYKNKYGEEREDVVKDLDIEEVEDENTNNDNVNNGNAGNNGLGGMSRSKGFSSSNDDSTSQQREYLLAVGTSIGVELYSCNPSSGGGESPYSGKMSYSLINRYVTNAGVNDLCFRGDGKKLALALSNGEIHEIDLQTKESDMRGTHGDLATAITYTVDNVLITGGSDNAVKVWDGSKAWVLVQHQDIITTIDTSPDGDYVVSGSRDTQVKYTYMDTATTTVLSKHNNWVTDLSFTPDGRYIMSVGADKLINRYNMTNDQLLYRGVHRNWVNDIDITRDSKFAITGDDNGRIYSWEYEVYGDNQFFVVGEYSKPVSSLSLTPDDKWLALSSGGTEVAFVNIENVIDKGTEKKNMAEASTKITHYTDVIYSMDVSYDDNYVLTGHPNGDVMLWDTKDGTFTKMTTHKGPVYDVAISSDLSIIASVGGDESGFAEGKFAGEILLWEEDEEEIRRVYQENSEFYSVAISPDSRIVAAGADQLVYLWNIKTHKKEIIELDQLALVNALKFDSSGNNLAVGLTDGSLLLININNSAKRFLNKVSSVINSLNFSGLKNYIYSSSQDGSLVKWNMKNGYKETIASRENNIIDFDYDKKEDSFIVMGVENKVVGINLRKEENNNFIITKHKGFIANIHKTEDDFKIISSGDDGIIKVSDLRKRSYYHNNMFFDLTLDIQETKDRLKWRNTEIDSKITNFLFQDNKNIYAMTNNNTIYAIDKETHRIIWTKEIEHLILSTPIATNSKIVCSSTTGKFIILDKASGKINEIDLLTNSAVADNNSYYVDGDNVYFGTKGSIKGGILYGINLNNNEIFLDYPITSGNFICTVVGDEEKIYAIDEGGTTYAFRKRDNELVWKQKTITENEKKAGKPSGLFRFTKPLLYQDKVIFGASPSITSKKSNTIIVAMNKENGKRMWLTEFSGTKVWPVKDNLGNGYFIDDLGILKINLSNGRMSRPFNISTSEISSKTRLGIYAQDLYLTSLNSNYIIKAFDVNTGEQKWEFYKKGYNSINIPLIDENNGLVYLNTYDKEEKKSVIMALNVAIGGIITKTFRIEDKKK